MKQAVLVAFVLLAACNNPSENKTQKAEPAAAASDESDELEAERKSIEQAADEAAKLVEADAKAEIDALAPAEGESGQ